MMATNADKARKALKANVVEKRLAEIAPNAGLLLGMLDEHKLDLMMLALGIGIVVPNPDFLNTDG